MRRRDFITMLAGSAVAWPRVTGALPQSVPVIGFLGSQSPDRELLADFLQGLNELGYFEGRNLNIEYRWAFNQYGQLPALAAGLVQRGVALIVTSGGSAAAKAARKATAAIPILFISGLDPVRQHLVASLSRPGGNATGLKNYNSELISKRLELLKELLHKGSAAEAQKIAYLINDDITGLEDQVGPIETAKSTALQLGLVIHRARSRSDIEVAFASMAAQQTKAVLIDSDPLFIRERALIVALAARYSLPAGYRDREFVEVGGLMSYGPSLPESWRQIGLYAGRILDGAKPEDLPVMLPRKYELVINRSCAKALGLSVRRMLADEVID